MTTNPPATVSVPPQILDRPEPKVPHHQRGKRYRLGVWAAINPVKVIAVWLVLLGFAVISAGYFTSHLTGNNGVVTGSQSAKAAQLIDKEFPGAPSETDFVVLHSQRATTSDAVFRQTVAVALARYHHGGRLWVLHVQHGFWRSSRWASCLAWPY